MMANCPSPRASPIVRWPNSGWFITAGTKLDSSTYSRNPPTDKIVARVPNRRCARRNE